MLLILLFITILIDVNINISNAIIIATGRTILSTSVVPSGVCGDIRYSGNGSSRCITTFTPCTGTGTDVDGNTDIPAAINYFTVTSTAVVVSL